LKVPSFDLFGNPAEPIENTLLEDDLSALTIPSAADQVLRETGECPPPKTRKPHSRYRHCPYCQHRDSAVIYWHTDTFICFHCHEQRPDRPRTEQRPAIYEFDEQVQKVVRSLVGKYGKWARRRRAELTQQARLFVQQYATGPAGGPNDSGKLGEWATDPQADHDYVARRVYTALHGDMRDYMKALVRRADRSRPSAAATSDPDDIVRETPPGPSPQINRGEWSEAVEEEYQTLGDPTEYMAEMAERSGYSADWTRADSPLAHTHIRCGIDPCCEDCTHERPIPGFVKVERPPLVTTVPPRFPDDPPIEYPPAFPYGFKGTIGELFGQCLICGGRTVTTAPYPNRTSHPNCRKVFDNDKVKFLWIPPKPQFGVERISRDGKQGLFLESGQELASVKHKTRRRAQERAPLRSGSEGITGTGQRWYGEEKVTEGVTTTAADEELRQARTEATKHARRWRSKHDPE
jgi:hypothetical protein